MAESAAGRIVLLTFPKCGSQWVRDVLFAPRLLAASGGVREGVRDHSLSGAWGLPELEPGTISGPIYGASAKKWKQFARPEDRAVVLLRDPRDVVVSWLYAALYSHAPVRPIDTYRECLRAIPRRARLLLAADVIGRQHGEAMLSWAKRRSSDQVHITTYERLLEGGSAGFREILDFLGWRAPEEDLSGVVEELSFERRAGRRPGEENRMSYFRKATPGDWRQHFDRLSGRLIEVLLPDLLVDLGYESDSDWWRRLPEELPGGEPAASSADAERAELLEAELERARAEAAEMARVAAERLEVIERINVEAEARLEIIEQLKKRLAADS